MSIKAILTAAALLAGSSSLVVAQPVYPYSSPPVYRYSPPSVYRYSPPPYSYQYTSPAPGFGAANPFINGRQWISLGGAVGRISLYTYGQTFIRSIDVYYLDGRVRRLRLRRVLSPANPRLDILIGRQPIRGLLIRGGGAGLAAGPS